MGFPIPMPRPMISSMSACGMRRSGWQGPGARSDRGCRTLACRIAAAMAGRTYGPPQIAAQIKATYDRGIPEFLMWDPKNRFNGLEGAMASLAQKGVKPRPTPPDDLKPPPKAPENAPAQPASNAPANAPARR